MGLQIRFEVGGKMNSARQSLRGAPDLMVVDASKALDNQFMGHRIRFKGGG